jgi:hypothetical protein
MKVDMSPEAVTARLREMDELCELSWKLMNAKKVKSLESKIDPLKERKMRVASFTRPSRRANSHVVDSVGQIEKFVGSPF